MPEVTEDTLFNGALHCLQHVNGYRFSVDAVLLAHFARPGNGDSVLDIGAGCGVVSLILCYRCPNIQVTALEIQASLASLISRNIERNELQERLFLQQGDLRAVKEYFAPEKFDLIVCNPPYGKPASGRINTGEEAAAARHEQYGNLDDIITAISYNLKNRGRAALVYPARRAAVLLAKLKNKGLEPKRLQVVYSYPGGGGRLVLVEAVKNGGEELLLEPAFFVYDKLGGSYSGAMSRLYEGEEG